jgi:pSer/pThr/pTyr-binding forkhead associated (FHA) protein
MPTITLKFKENVLSEFQLDKGQAMTIGRKDVNDITIENLAVSARHAKIDSVGDGYLLTDLQSKNGSFVNNQNVTSHWLKHGDIITIGKHTLVFGHEEEAAQADAAPSAMDQTMVMDTEQYRSMLSKGGGNEANKALDEAPPAILSYLSGGEGEVELTGKLIKIGKNSGSDVVVSGLMVGQTAATISKRPDGYFLSYVGGMAKPKVNEAVVKESVKLNEFDTIELGSVKLQFVLKK